MAENDIWLPLAGMHEVFARTPTTKQMLVLRRADHLRFMDNVEEVHEAMRAMRWTGDLAWIGNEVRPIAELCSGEHAHRLVRGLALCHMDAALRQREEAERLLGGDAVAALTARGLGDLVKAAVAGASPS